MNLTRLSHALTVLFGLYITRVWRPTLEDENDRKGQVTYAVKTWHIERAYYHSYIYSQAL